MQRTVRELVAAMGYTDAIELCRGWGGRELAVPMKVAPDHPLALRLGLVAAERLIAAFRGQRLQLPVERDALLDERNAAIVAAVKAGRSRAAVSDEFGVSRQTVNYVLRRAAEAETPAVAGGNCERRAEEFNPP